MIAALSLVVRSIFIWTKPTYALCYIKRMVIIVRLSHALHAGEINMKISRAFFNVIVLVCSLNTQAGLLPNIFRSRGAIILTTSGIIAVGGYHFFAHKKAASAQPPIPMPKEKAAQKIDDKLSFWWGMIGR
jgi:hypothetical protein